MRQQAINTFNEGLNYDLSPLTTPNNVLTDCVNGTFITFNGDELALQNDAGNTKIQIPGKDPVEYVTLSPGFYPLGIKEYGGVLYIISGKLPSVLAKDILEFSPDTTYQKNNTVKYRTNENFPYIYYKYISDISGKYSSLPIVSNTSWEVIGEEADYNNYFGEVEIGSYPSPEASGNETFIGHDLDLSTLYKPLVINKELFKTGRYITFGVAEGINLNYISHYVKTGGEFVYKPSFYKIKLLHQLSNGYIDLTDTIWTKYLETLDVTDGATKYHWLDPIGGEDFKFYCPSLYKGLLSITVELEPLESFRLNDIYTTPFTDPNYTITIPVWIEPAVGSDITIPLVRIEYKIAGGTTVIDTVAISGNKGEFTVTTGIANKDKSFSYNITPIIEVNGTKYSMPGTIPGEPTIEGLLPYEFIRENMLHGSFIISSNYDDIRFLRVNNTIGCVDGFKTYLEYILVNANNEFLDPTTFTVSVTPFIFLEDGTTQDTVGATIIETYTVVNNKPVLSTPNTVDPILASLFEDLIVVEACENTEILTITFNMALNASDIIEVAQNGITNSFTGFTSQIVNIDILLDVETSITILKPGFSGSITKTFTTPNPTISLALIANVTYDPMAGDTFRLVWASSTDALPIIDPPIYWLYTTNLSDYPATLTWYNSTEYKTNIFSVINVGLLTHAIFNNWDSEVGDSTYANINTTGTYIMYQGLIFEKTIWV